MLSPIKMTLSCIDDQSVNCTFIAYENIRLLMLFERDPRGKRLLRSSVLSKANRYSTEPF